MFRLLILAGLILTCSCSNYHLKPIEGGAPPAIKLADEFIYYDYLKEKPRASTADAARIFCLIYNKYPWTMSGEEMKKVLLDKKIIKPHWEISEAAPLTAGKLAFMICYSIPIKTSMIMAVSAPSQRYSLREAAFHEIMDLSGIYRYISGQELINIIARAENFRKEFNIK